MLTVTNFPCSMCGIESILGMNWLDSVVRGDNNKYLFFNHYSKERLVRHMRLVFSE